MASSELACDLKALTIEHLRGFDRAVLRLDRKNIVLVGPNNSGKTSLLRLLHWVLNDVDRELLTGRRKLTARESSLLLPARDTRGGARRITLAVGIADGRRHRGHQAKDGVATLRLQLRGGDGGVIALLGPPTRGEARESNEKAIALFEAVQACHPTIFVAPSRDASSEAFGSALREAVRIRLADRLVHEERGGAPGEYRQVARALKTIEGLAQKQAETLISDLREGLSGSMTRSSKVDFDATPLGLVDWLAERAGLLLSTGDHDQRMVPPRELGSGLQSVLVMQLLTSAPRHGATPLLLLEEPEAFLHPAAQRTLARSLFDADDVRLVTSTHSTVVVDESVAADVVLVSRHRVFSPSDADDRRRSINTALLTGQGSEAIFARSVLLLEGPGDRAFYEVLRRRMGSFLGLDPVSHLGIVAVGGKERFAPWLQLLEAYADKHSGHRPIAFLAVGDSADAAPDLARAYRDARLSMPSDLDRLTKEVASAFGAADVVTGLAKTLAYNACAEDVATGLAMSPVDLEYAMLEMATPATIETLADMFGLKAGSSEDLMVALGSKVRGKAIQSPAKGDWIRAEVAKMLPWEEVSPSVRLILRRWVSPLLNEAGLEVPSELK